MNKAMQINLGSGTALTTKMGVAKPSARITRRPKHQFRLRCTPWAIHPTMIAPVLPGETMENMLLQVRAVTDPLKDKLGGWWHEHYFFYVKLTDLEARDDFQAMLVEGASLSTLNSAAAFQTYHFGGAPNFVQMCLETVTEWYFRDQGDTWDEAGQTITIGTETLPLAKASDRLWWDSLKLHAEQPTDDSSLPGEGEDLPDHLAAFSTAHDQWKFMRDMKLTEVTFEDYLKTYGIRAETGAKEDERKPELLRYVRDWSYPSNTVDPADGSVASAVSWALSERADKNRFFREPGFIFGVTVSRPKINWKGQKGHVAAALSTPYTWLPAVMMDNPYTSLVQFEETAGPVPGIFDATDSYWFDARDLFLYGDQFVNYDLENTTQQADDANAPALPASSGAGNIRHEFVDSGDIAALFSDASAATNGTDKVRVDGVASLNIKSHQRDTT